MEKESITFKKITFEAINSGKHDWEIYFVAGAKITYLISGNGYAHDSIGEEGLIKYLQDLVEEKGFPKKGKLEISFDD